MKRKKIILIVIAVALVILVAFCLLYTRPKSLSLLLDNRKITSISALAVKTGVSDGEGYHDVWKLDGDSVTEQTLADLVFLMNHEQYRTSLYSLIPSNSYDLGGHDRTVHLHLVLENNDSVTIIYSGSKVVITGEKYIVGSISKSVCTSLAEYIMEHGTKD